MPEAIHNPRRNSSNDWQWTGSLISRRQRLKFFSSFVPFGLVMVKVTFASQTISPLSSKTPIAIFAVSKGLYTVLFGFKARTPQVKSQIPQ